MSISAKNSVLALIITSTVCTAQAQGGFQLNLGYHIATPVGPDLRDYINSTSTRGGQGSLLYGFSRQLRAGVQVAFSNFYRKNDRQVYQTEDGAHVSAVLSNTLQTLPILAKGEYTFLKTGFIQPYVGLGAGVNLINFNQYIGAFSYNVNHTKAAFTGDLGLFVPFVKNSSLGFRLSTSYNLMLFNEEGIDRLDTWNVQVGFSFPLGK